MTMPSASFRFSASPASSRNGASRWARRSGAPDYSWKEQKPCWTSHSEEWACRWWAPRAATENLRGNAALQKLGAVRQGVIPNGLVLADRTYDQYYWTLSADGRPRKKIVWDLGTH